MDIKGIALSKQMDERRNLLRYPDGPLSPARPIIPTFEGFDTQPPTNLANFTDGSPDTATGEGIKEISTSGVAGAFVFDLGSEYNVLITGCINFGATGGITTTAYIDFIRADMSSIFSSSYNTFTNGTYPIKRFLNPVSGTARYIKVRIVGSGGGVVSASGVELSAYKLGEL